MRIRCPSCSATYEVADALLDPPRMVRCARCAHDWVAEPVAADPTPEPPAETELPAHEPAIQPAADDVTVDERYPEPEPAFGDTPLSAIERLAAPVDLSPRIRRRDRLLTVAWAASFALLAALGVAGYTQRDRLMEEWPASKRVYARLGLLPADAKGRDAKAPDTTTEH
jgi:predicted Zn finger-like uncharacterized protein